MSGCIAVCARRILRNIEKSPAPGRVFFHRGVTSALTQRHVGQIDVMVGQESLWRAGSGRQGVWGVGHSSPGMRS